MSTGIKTLIIVCALSLSALFYTVSAAKGTVNPNPEIVACETIKDVQVQASIFGTDVKVYAVHESTLIRDVMERLYGLAPIQFDQVVVVSHEESPTVNLGFFKDDCFQFPIIGVNKEIWQSIIDRALNTKA